MMMMMTMTLMMTIMTTTTMMMLMLMVVTGKSLLWVAILGLIVFYIYALISFALLRSSFDPDNELYCATLWQCTVTVVRYGLVGDLFDVSNSSLHYICFITF